MEIKDFGTLQDGRGSKLYTLKNAAGLTVALTDFGAAVVSVGIPKKGGGLCDVVLGFDSVAGYEKTAYYLGATVGRHAGQIEKCSFDLNGKTYRLFDNDHGNSMHGGQKGFNKRLFAAVPLAENTVSFLYYSPDGEEGYPGNLRVSVTYTLGEDGALRMDYDACSDADTVLNMTNHSYFNLNGHDSGTILGHVLYVDSDAFTADDANGMPTGAILPVKDTPMDFRVPTPIGSRIDAAYDQVRIFNGYDHNWILHQNGDINRLCARLTNENGCRSVEVYTTKPGIQIYSGNNIDGGEIGKGGCVYRFRQAVCMETQFYPNALNNRHFPSVILCAGARYQHSTIYKFAWS